jgi:putative endonuclease
MKKQETGRLGEDLACRALKKKGYRILERNYRCRYGEIDVVARKGDYLVFVEVRSKTGTAFGTPEESVTAQKKQRLAASVMSYLESHVTPQENWRVDFVAVELDAGGSKASRIEIIENALG